MDNILFSIVIIIFAFAALFLTVLKMSSSVYFNVISPTMDGSSQKPFIIDSSNGEFLRFENSAGNILIRLADDDSLEFVDEAFNIVIWKINSTESEFNNISKLSKSVISRTLPAIPLNTGDWSKFKAL